MQVEGANARREPPDELAALEAERGGTDVEVAGVEEDPEAGQLLDPNLSVKDVGISPESRLLLRPRQVSGGA